MIEITRRDFIMRTGKNAVILLGGSLIYPGLSIAADKPELAEKRRKRLERKIDYDKIFQDIDSPMLCNKNLIRAIAYTESSWLPKKISNDEAYGLLQLKRDAWEDVSDKEFLPYVFIPHENVKTGVQYAQWIINILQKNDSEWQKLESITRLEKILTAYKEGIGLLEKSKWNPKWLPITNRTKARNYISKIKKMHGFYNYQHGA